MVDYDRVRACYETGGNIIEMLKDLDGLVAVLLISTLPLEAALVGRDALEPQQSLRMQVLTRGRSTSRSHLIELTRVNLKQDLRR